MVTEKFPIQSTCKLVSLAKKGARFFESLASWTLHIKWWLPLPGPSCGRLLDDSHHSENPSSNKVHNSHNWCHPINRHSCLIDKNYSPLYKQRTRAEWSPWQYLRKSYHTQHIHPMHTDTSHSDEFSVQFYKAYLPTWAKAFHKQQQLLP